MAWEVEFTDAFELWWNSLNEDQQEEIDAKVLLLEERGPVLPRPHSDVITTSKHSNMKELRGSVNEVSFASCTHSIRVEPQFCLSEETRVEIQIGIVNLFPWLTIYSIVT